MTAFETDLLAELIQQKRACLEQLRDLGRRQLALIESGDINELLRVLGAKQQTLNALNQLERRLDPFREESPDDRRWRTPEDRARCGEVVSACEAIFAEIVSQEKQGEQQLRMRRDEAAARLAGAHWAGQARGAYSESAAPRPGQLDLSSET